MNFFKKIGRATAGIHTKVNRVVVPVAAAAGTYFGGPIVGEAVAAIGSTGGYYFAATDARNRGIQGRDARAFGRAERSRELMYAQIGVGAGALGSGFSSLASGGSFFGGALAGQGGQALLGGTNLLSPGLTTTEIAKAQTALAIGNMMGGMSVNPVAGVPLMAGTVPTGVASMSAATAALETTGAAGALKTALEQGLKYIPKNVPTTPTGGWPRIPGGGGAGSGGSAGGDTGGGSYGGNVKDPNAQSSLALPLLLLGGLFLLSA